MQTAQLLSVTSAITAFRKDPPPTASALLLDVVVELQLATVQDRLNDVNEGNVPDAHDRVANVEDKVHIEGVRKQ